MNAEQLRATLLADGLDRVVDDLMASAMPAVRIFSERVEDAEIPIGASKLGGLPDLQPGVEWPAWHEHMAFIGQFNLAAVASHDREGVLPAQGLLSFFYETDGEPLHSARWGLPEDAPYLDDYGLDLSLGWRVLYHDADPATFVRHGRPADLNEWVRYPACAARFATDYTLPDVDGPEIYPLGLTPQERTQLIGLDTPINRGTWEEGVTVCWATHTIWVTIVWWRPMQAPAFGLTSGLPRTLINAALSKRQRLPNGDCSCKLIARAPLKWIGLEAVYCILSLSRQPYAPTISPKPGSICSFSRCLHCSRLQLLSPPRDTRTPGATPCFTKPPLLVALP